MVFLVPYYKCRVQIISVLIILLSLFTCILQCMVVVLQFNFFSFVQVKSFSLSLHVFSKATQQEPKEIEDNPTFVSCIVFDLKLYNISSDLPILFYLESVNFNEILHIELMVTVLVCSLQDLVRPP